MGKKKKKAGQFHCLSTLALKRILAEENIDLESPVHEQFAVIANGTRYSSDQLRISVCAYGISELKSWNGDSGKDKLGDFVDRYWHYDNITKMLESKFIDHYCRWARKKGIPSKPE